MWWRVSQQLTIHLHVDAGEREGPAAGVPVGGLEVAIACRQRLIDVPHAAAQVGEQRRPAERRVGAGDEIGVMVDGAEVGNAVGPPLLVERAQHAGDRQRGVVEHRSERVFFF